MARNGKKSEGNTANPASAPHSELTDDLDALFALPLAEFTAGRNALAVRLKRDGRGADADHVKTLAKPSISAWAVNQLYWKQREPFDRLIAAGERVRQAQASLIAGKVADIREPLEARRAMLSDLSRLAASLLRDAGLHPTPDKMSRIGTTLEAMSVYASLPTAPNPGHLTDDIDPPGFDVLTSMTPGIGVTEQNKAPVTPPHKSDEARQKTQSDDANRIEETRQAKMAAAKTSLQESEHTLRESRSRARKAEAALKKAEEDAREAEQRKREAGERFEKASATSEEAAQRARNVAAELKQAGKAMEDAERTVEQASQELQKLSQ